MPTEQEYINYKYFVESLDEATPTADDEVVFTDVNGPKKSLFSLIATFVHSKWAAFVHACTAITSFASGDTFSVSNPTDGTRKMSKDTLLTLTSQNTLAGNVAPAFVPNSTTTVAGLPYVYGGALYMAKEAYQGPWDANKFSVINVDGVIQTRIKESNNWLCKLLDEKIPVVIQSFDPSKCTDGVIIASNGLEEAFTNFSASDYIDIGSEEIFYKNNVSSVTCSEGYCYDLYKNRLGKATRIESVRGIVKLKTLKNTAFIRFSLETSQKNSTYFYKWDKPIGLFASEYGTQRYGESFIASMDAHNKDLFADVSVQLFDKSNTNDNHLINDSGVVSSFNGYAVTNPIYIGSMEYFYRNLYMSSLSGSAGVCFDERGQFLGLATIVESVNGIVKQRTLEGTVYVLFTIEMRWKDLFSVYAKSMPSGDFTQALNYRCLPDYLFHAEDFAPVVKQLFDKSNTNDNHLINNSGVISEFNNFAVTNKIYIGSMEYFYRNRYMSSLSGSAGVCFGESDQFLGLATIVENIDGIIKQRTLEGTKYVLFTIEMGWKDAFSVYAKSMPSGDFTRPYGDKTLPSWLGVETEQIVQNITKTINNYSDTYENTYNLTVTPHITTDSHSWLAAVDENTQDETGKTDMTSAIMAMLTETGYCHLGEGIFYVSGSIDMPVGSTLVGCGHKTIIRLLSSVQSGYIVKLGSSCTIKDLSLSGGYTAPTISAEDPVGNRHGVFFKGNADGEEGETVYTTANCILTGLRISNFAGGGITCHNTGYNHNSSILATNCIIYNCHAGINIDYFSEYNRFTNMMIFNCHYACVNNGGNNIFVNCTFQGIAGFIIDNSENDKPNSAHGSCVGCSFNHQNNNVGNAIELYGVTSGFVFTGCQFFYGMLYMENSSGIVIDSCNFGQNEAITVLDGGLIMFANDCFGNAPTITIQNNNIVKFINSFTRSGAVVSG